MAIDMNIPFVAAKSFAMDKLLLPLRSLDIHMDIKGIKCMEKMLIITDSNYDNIADY